MKQDEQVPSGRELLDAPGEGLMHEKASGFYILITGELIVNISDSGLGVSVMLHTKAPEAIREKLDSMLKEAMTQRDRDDFFVSTREVETVMAAVPDTIVPSVSRETLGTEIKELFVRTLREALEREALLHFKDAFDMTLLRHDPRLGTIRQAIEDHLSDTAGGIRKTFGLKARGRFSPWTPITLTRAIVDVVGRYPRETHSYANVAKRLQQHYQDKAPPSADALKKLVKRMKLNWDALTKLE